MVVVIGEVVLVASSVPPVIALYHRTLSAGVAGVADIVPDPQTNVLKGVGAPGMITVSVTAIRAEVLSHKVVVL